MHSVACRLLTFEYKSLRPGSHSRQTFEMSRDFTDKVVLKLVPDNIRHSALGSHLQRQSTVTYGKVGKSLLTLSGAPFLA